MMDWLEDEDLSLEDMLDDSPQEAPPVQTTEFFGEIKNNIESYDVFQFESNQEEDEVFDALKAQKDAEEADTEVTKVIVEELRKTIDGTSLVTRRIKEDKEERVYAMNSEHIRKCKNVVTRDKIDHGKPVVKKESNAPVLWFFAIVAFGVATACAIMSNSYHNFSPQATAMTCFWHGLLSDALVGQKVPFTLMPIDVVLFLKVFVSVFLIVMALGVLAWLDAEQRRQSRVGHEHGAARLATHSDFAKFQDRFTE